MDQNSATEQLPNVPKEWHSDATGIGLYKHSRQVIASNWKPLLVITLLSWIFGGGGGVGDDNVTMNIDTLLPIFLLGTIFWLLAAWIGTALGAGILDSIDNKKVSMGAAFGKSTKVFLKIIAASIVSYTIIGFGLLLLIVPGIIFAIRLSFVHYLIIDKNMGPLEAIQESWNMTKGNARKVLQVWSFHILAFLLMITIVGIPFSLYFLFMYSAALAITYRYVLNNPTAQPQTEATTTT